MEKRMLGRSGLAVTVLGYGAMELRHLSESEANPLMNTVLDQGINYIDTSPDYGPSEAYIGKAIAHRRKEYYLASKCGCNIDEDGKGQAPAHVWSRAQLLKNIENSLRLLKTDHLDVWQLHGPAPEELPGGAQDEVIRTMQELKQQGKVRWIGMSYKNGGASDPLYPDRYSPRYIRHYLDFEVFDVMQLVYGGMARRGEAGLALAASRGVGIVARGVVKKYYPDFAEQFEKAGLAELLAPGEDMNCFLLRIALSQPGVSTMIIGTKNPAHLAENISSAEKGRLSTEVYRHAAARLGAAGFIADAPQ